MGGDKLVFADCAKEIRKTIRPEDASGNRYIGLEHIDQGTLHLNGYGFAEDVSSAKAMFLKGDILFGKLRPYFRKVVRAPFNGVCSTDIWVVRAKNGINQDFLYYWMASLDFVNVSMQGSEGTKMPRAKWEHVGKHEIPFFGETEQCAIAHILGSLDDKIELNRRMNATLEAIAQALFKSWFVDLDPVIDNALAAGNPIPEPLQSRAKTRKALGDKRKPLPEAIQKQFPNRFTFTEEMGWVPERWEARAIGDKFQLLGGHSFKSSEYVEDGIYGVVTIRNVQDGNFVEECANRINDLPLKMKGHCKLNVGDVLLSLTGNVGRVCIVSSGNYLLNQRVSKIVGNDGIPKSFAYLFFRQSSLYEMMLTIAKGTAQQNLSPIETLKLKQVLPENKKIVDLSMVFKPTFDKIVANAVQSQFLEKLRDTLLPKLISGQLRIPDAEKLLAEVV